MPAFDIDETVRPEAAIDIGQVDAVIAGQFRLMRFGPALERSFERDAIHRCRVLIRQNYIGLLVYDLFVFGDRLLVPDILGFSIILHFAVMTPLMILVNLVLSLRPPVWLREGLLALTIVVTTAAILLLMVISRSPLRTSEHLSIVLVILFATMVQRIRFWYVLVACLASLGLYVAGLCQLFPTHPERTILADAVFAGVVLFSLIGCYNLEHEQRMGFLLRVRDRFRNSELEALSRRDALTGIGNRHALELALDRAHVGGARLLAILLCDIDFFKAFNDANGHLVGDACLRQVAALIAGELRKPEDALFRFGGEEFLVVLRDCDVAGAVLLAERIRAAVARAAIARDGLRETFVTISVGCAAGPVGERRDASALIAAADAALYAAKGHGRDQVWPRLDAEAFQASAFQDEKAA